jgi:tyramine---L-glutamate ligase
MFLASKDALGARSSEWTGELIAQDYIPGFAASVAFLICSRGIVPLIPCEQLLSTDGRFRYQGGRLPIRPELAERAMKIATAAVSCVPGLLGYVGVDVILGDDGRDWAIEINPRITTSYVGLRALAKFNMAGAMLAAVEGRELPLMEWHDGQIEFTPDGHVTPIPRAGWSASPSPTSDRDERPRSEARPRE